MISVGPFPLMALIVLLAAAVAVLVARALLKNIEGAQKTVASVMLDALLLGVLAARLGYVLQFFSVYRADPLSIIRLGDGGFSLLAGVLAMLGYGVWRTRKTPGLRRPLLWGLGAGLLFWFAASQSLALLQRSTLPLPQTVLLDSQGQPAPLAQFSGRPLVLNLWATWCGPCRREMPVLVAAQQTHADIAFVFANQGEDAAEIAAYLQAEGLHPQHMLRDPHSDVMRETGARALPTTLFYDAEGRLRDVQMGELNMPMLEAKLQRLR